MTSRIQIRIKVMRIRNTGLKWSSDEQSFKNSAAAGTYCQYFAQYGSRSSVVDLEWYVIYMINNTIPEEVHFWTESDLSLNYAHPRLFDNFSIFLSNFNKFASIRQLRIRIRSDTKLFARSRLKNLERVTVGDSWTDIHKYLINWKGSVRNLVKSSW